MVDVDVGLDPQKKGAKFGRLGWLPTKNLKRKSQQIKETIIEAE